MRYLPDGAWMQRADEYTIQKIGIPSLVLMERAALKTVEVMKEKGISLDHCLVVCGSGNNGGDGFAVARLLYLEGKDVCAVFAGKDEILSRQQSIDELVADRTSGVAYGLKFTKHADARLEQRDIRLTDEQMIRLEEGTKKAYSKGIKESLVLVDNLAFIVNTDKKTVITAIDQNSSDDNIYTNIDGAVVM